MHQPRLPRGIETLLLKHVSGLLLYFWKENSGICTATSAVLEHFLVRQGRAPIVLKVDIQREHALARLLNVNTAPSFVLLDGGGEVCRLSGDVGMDDIVDFVGALQRRPKRNVSFGPLGLTIR